MGQLPIASKSFKNQSPDAPPKTTVYRCLCTTPAVQRVSISGHRFPCVNLIVTGREALKPICTEQFPMGITGKSVGFSTPQKRALPRSVWELRCCPQHVKRVPHAAGLRSTQTGTYGGATTSRGGLRGAISSWCRIRRRGSRREYRGNCSVRRLKSSEQTKQATRKHYLRSPSIIDHHDVL